MAPARPRRTTGPPAGRRQPISALYRLLWLMTVVGLMLAMRYFIPEFAEEIQYAVTRGRQRAEYEGAGLALRESSLKGISDAYQFVSQRVGPSVVHIDVRPVGAGLDDAITRTGQSPHWESRGQGSGVIVDVDGFIVTNHHVVEGAGDIRVTLSDGRRRQARLVGFDELTDLAVLKIEADRLISAEWRDGEEPEVGAMVWAVGSPFGLQRSVTFGILSAKHRAGVAGKVHQDFLQTDAAVNPGNSGGPLVDAKGQIVGINTAIVGETYQGIGFAIPAGVARQIYEQLRGTGRVARGYLGVRMDEVTEATAERLGADDHRGALVVVVMDPSPASQAGIEPDDIILSWNGEQVTSPSSLSRYVAATGVGSEATVGVLRQGQRVELTVTVGELNLR